MSALERVIQKLGDLTPEQQAEVLRLVEMLANRRTTTSRRTSPIGALTDLNVDISAEDIAEARAEMWSRFPREVAAE